jgi:hypothetical protein
MLVSLLLCGPAPAQRAATCKPPAPASAFDPVRPNLGQLKLQLLYYQCAGYAEDVHAELGRARAWVEQRARRSRTGSK